ncbi:ABC transporter ATP-binding protein [Actinomarinicola tropica]|uniref:ATP-binding cassette domain-containing protein n=1 Tax=Actinomarinicola tropica TaxID=2789776 RepID=A0A5Q2RJZ7_9ACTN|nr:ABC transporter ATP-binding protein [Actinomarinicola tropica]QGG96153.1 ATP-binding cassette domain-containing protein [Actinomarinicola tropica]
MSRARGPEARLLLTALGPERRKLTGVMLVLLVALALRLAMPAMLGWFVDAAIDGRELSLLTAIAAAYVAVALTAEVLSLVVTWGSVSVSWRAGNRLRERLARHALRLDMGWHARHSPGQLIERIDGDVEALALFFNNVLVHVVGNLLLLVGMLVVAFTISPWAGLLLVVTCALGATVLVKVRAAAVPAREAEREANAILYGDLEERLGGLEDLKANGAGAYAVHRLHTNSARTWRAARRASLLGDGSYAFAAITFAFGSVLTLGLGFVLVQREMVTVGQVLALFRYSEMLRQPLERIAEQMKEMQKALAGARRASTMLAEEPRIADPGSDRHLPAGALAVELDGVTFTYPGTDRPALSRTDLAIAPGTHVGVVGRTGSGKTTLGRLLLRLWDATDGHVRLGGVDVRDLSLAELRARVAVVTQDVELFRASTRDNLTLFGARPATDEELVAILRRVGLGSWLDHQSDGLDTPIEGGGLSAGEAQLLAVARAFLADPGLVILDEASSRLDPITEAALSHAVAELLEGRTALVIAHRLATLDRVDEIVVVENGHVAEHGSRAALAQDPASRYAALLATAGSLPIEEALETFADDEGLGA